MRAILILALIAVAAPFGLGALLLDRAPLVADAPAPAPDDLRRARDALKEFRRLTELDAPDRRLTLTASDLRAIGVAASHLAPYVEAEANLASGRVVAAASAAIPKSPLPLWLNVEAALRPSDTGLEFDRLSVGGLPLPTTLTPRAAAFALDLVLGDNLGQTALAAIGGLDITGDEATFRIALTREQRRAFAGRAKSLARGVVGVVGADIAAAHYAAITAAAASGALPASGSAGPYIAAALRLAGESAASGAPPRAALQGALFALGAHCGTHRVEDVVGRIHPEAGRDIDTCGRNTLAGRNDLLRHFAVSAALEAASDGDAAFAVGEIKELLDAAGGSGFSFADLAADRAGARFAAALRRTEPVNWPALASLLVDEAAVMPPIRGLREGLGEAAFTRDYRNVDSPAYRDALAQIDAAIDPLPFFRAVR